MLPMKEDIPGLSDERAITTKYLADQVALSVIHMNNTFALSQRM
jgi:hypothetical protein